MKCGTCGHWRSFHATPTQGRTNIYCEYPGCDCPDLTEPKDVSPPPLQPGQVVWVRGIWIGNGKEGRGVVTIPSRYADCTVDMPLSAIRTEPGNGNTGKGE